METQLMSQKSDRLGCLAPRWRDKRHWFTGRSSAGLPLDTPPGGFGSFQDHSFWRPPGRLITFYSLFLHASWRADRIIKEAAACVNIIRAFWVVADTDVMLAHLSIQVQKVLRRGKTNGKSNLTHVCVRVDGRGWAGRVSHFLPQICLTFYLLVTPSGRLGFQTTSCFCLYLMTIRLFPLLDSSAGEQFIVQKISRKTARLSPLFVASC